MVRFGRHWSAFFFGEGIFFFENCISPGIRSLRRKRTCYTKTAITLLTVPAGTKVSLEACRLGYNEEKEKDAVVKYFFCNKSAVRVGKMPFFSFWSVCRVLSCLGIGTIRMMLHSICEQFCRSIGPVARCSSMVAMCRFDNCDGFARKRSVARLVMLEHVLLCTTLKEGGGVK